MIQGNSGYKIELVDGCIQKTGDTARHPRLKKQIEKQIAYAALLTTGFKVPEVLGEIPGGFIMEYVRHAENSIQFFEHTDITTIKQRVDTICQLVDSFIARSPIMDCSSACLAKVRDLITQLEPRVTVETCTALHKFLGMLKGLGPIVIPVGIAHGDLTFSNILFTKSSISMDMKEGPCVYLIDFLDSFIETPLIDIVKLRQDTQYKWIIHFTPFPFDRTKVGILLDYLDTRIDTYFRTCYPDMYAYYWVFEIINLMRLLPYLTRSTANTLFKQIETTITNLILCRSSYPQQGNPPDLQEVSPNGY